jgi:hypothetical protein
MRGKRFFLVLVLAVVLVAGWFLTLRSASGVEDIQKQSQLVEQADGYLGKKLYVRGIPLLEEALSYETDQVDAIQRKLLNAYYAYGDMDSYDALLSLMEQNQNATADDYLLLANVQLNDGGVESAIETAKAGLSKHEDEKLKNFYETYRYAYTISQTDYETVVPTAEGDMQPAFDGTSWNYVSYRGGVQLEVNAKEAYAFNVNGYGVVKRDGSYCTILENGDLYGIDEENLNQVKGVTDNYILAEKIGQYGYYNYDFERLSDTLLFEDITLNHCGVTTVKNNGSWAIITDSGELVTDYIYEDVAVSSLGYVFSGNHGMVKKDGKWILIDTEGNQLCESVFEDAKAPESDGYIAVADENGKWGFIDALGTLVVDYKYSDAKSFSCDLGAVEVGNEWGYISKSNVMVIAAEYEEAQPFFAGAAIVDTVEGAAVIQLKYYEALTES